MIKIIFLVTFLAVLLAIIISKTETVQDKPEKVMVAEEIQDTNDELSNR